LPAARAVRNTQPESKPKAGKNQGQARPVHLTRGLKGKPLPDVPREFTDMPLAWTKPPSTTRSESVAGEFVALARCMN
jgi:hypothetical protein